MASAGRPLRNSNVPATLTGVGDRLRQMFDSVLSDPLPEHILDLVDQLEAQNGDEEEPAERRVACLTPA